jgi:hypothetical protein
MSISFEIELVQANKTVIISFLKEKIIVWISEIHGKNQGKRYIDIGIVKLLFKTYLYTIMLLKSNHHKQLRTLE